MSKYLELVSAAKAAGALYLLAILRMRKAFLISPEGQAELEIFEEELKREIHG
jgi:hypothetical protein